MEGSHNHTTPGHVDFSAEMERVLQVLDCAVLVVSGADGVQGHTQTLWKLLKRYQIPTFLFVNKMDQEGTDGEKLLKELRKRFGENVVPFVDIRTESDCPGGKVYLHTKESAVEEVLEELAHLQGWTDGEIRHTREEKAQTTGLFRERVFLEKVLEEGGSHG